MNCPKMKECKIELKFYSIYRIYYKSINIINNKPVCVLIDSRLISKISSQMKHYFADASDNCATRARQGFRCPESPANQCKKEDSHTPSSCDRSSTLVGDLANVDYDTAKIHCLL